MSDAAGLVVPLLDRAETWLSKWKRRRVGRKFKKLSPQQRGFLLVASAKGSRHFSIGSDEAYMHERWFEELVEWNYLSKPHSPLVAPEALDCSITVPGWKQIEKFKEAQP